MTVPAPVVVQEAVVVIKDIFRRYPNKYESVIATLCDNLEKAEGLRERLGRAVPWMEYAEAIVGLTAGVEDHDHERLVACLECGFQPTLTGYSRERVCRCAVDA